MYHSCHKYHIPILGGWYKWYVWYYFSVGVTKLHKTSSVEKTKFYADFTCTCI